MSAILPRYKCEAIASEVSRLLNLSPALSWQAVREYASPRLPGLADPVTIRYPDHMRALIARRLDVELRHHHVWVNR